MLNASWLALDLNYQKSVKFSVCCFIFYHLFLVIVLFHEAIKFNTFTVYPFREQRICCKHGLFTPDVKLVPIRLPREDDKPLAHFC